MYSSTIIPIVIDRIDFWKQRFPKVEARFVPNRHADAFYMVQKCVGSNPSVQIRLSDRGTYLNTWTDSGEMWEGFERLDPSQAVNISIVFVDKGNGITKDCDGQSNCEGCKLPVCMPRKFDGQTEKPFKVIQYVYQSKNIYPRYFKGLAKAIFHARHTGEYIDPLRNTPSAAKVMELNSANPCLKK